MGMIKIPNKSTNYFKEHLDNIINTGHLAEGEWNDKLAKYVKELTQSKYSTVTNSNGAGMVALLSLFRFFKKRSHVLIQANTMYGVKAMVPASGCELYGYINCQVNTLMPSLQDIVNAISSIDRFDKKKLIILLSHIGGIINPDIKKISKLCKNEDIILLEDCAHSFGATLDGDHSGLFGDAGVYSFYATKAIMAGEGGVVVTNNSEIGEMLEKYVIYDRFDQDLGIGNNIRISEIQALFCFSIVKEWNEIIANKKVIAERYIDLCNKNNISYINQESRLQSGNYYKFILFSENQNIYQKYPKIKTTTSAVYDYSIGIHNVVANSHLCLPIWYGQEEDITDKVCEELQK